MIFSLMCTRINPHHLVLHSFTKQCSLLHLHTCIVSIGVHLCVTVQYLHYISDEYQITDGGKTA